MRTRTSTAKTPSRSKTPTKRMTRRWDFRKARGGTRSGACATGCSKVDPTEEEVAGWTWHRVESLLTSEFGFAAADVKTLV
jgi:hypothetical protein